MRQFLLLITAILIIQTSANAQCGERYKTRFFNNIQVFRDIEYSLNAPTLIAASLTTETTFNKDLIMDVFMPPVADTVTNRPVVVLGHGGGFINIAFMGGTSLVGTMDNDDVQALADTLAHWGYIAAVIEYRLGFNVGSPSSIQRAFWRGAQDMSAAIRFFRKNASWFGVDPNRVFSGGTSAGAFCALYAGFIDAPERMAETYQLVPIFKKDLGALHSRSIVELSSFNPFTGTGVTGDDVDSIPRGIAAYWGAIEELNWISQGPNQAPTIMFHGTSDPIVSNKCNKPFANVALVAPTTCGSYMMDSIMTLHSMPHEVYYGQGEFHEYWGVLNGNWLPGGPNAYWSGIIQKTADFFYGIMQPAMPQVTGPDTVQSMTNYSYSIVNPLLNHTYCWEITGGVIVSPVTNGSTIEVQFYNTSSQGMVMGSAVDPARFVSEKGTKSSIVTINAAVDKIKAPIVQVKLQPNPAQKQVAIVINSTKEMEGKVLLYNTLGQPVLTQKMYIQKGRNQQVLNVEHLAKGAYFVEVISEEARFVERLVVE
jgi:acetyl esterase/lipase